MACGKPKCVEKRNAIAQAKAAAVKEGQSENTFFAQKTKRPTTPSRTVSPTPVRKRG
jgi:hypothetical protein